jgi:hypothetical protein
MNIEILIGRNLNQSESIILNHFMNPFSVLNSNIYFLSYVFCQEMFPWHKLLLLEIFGNVNNLQEAFTARGIVSLYPKSTDVVLIKYI